MYLIIKYSRDLFFLTHVIFFKIQIYKVAYKTKLSYQILTNKEKEYFVYNKFLYYFIKKIYK